MREAIHVHLEWNEIPGPAITGILRYVLSRRDKRAAETPDPFWTDIQSSCAEAAFAKYTKQHNPHAIDTFKTKADVAGYEIRWGEDRDSSLIIRPNDNPEAMYILVVGRVPDFWLIGGIRGLQARRDKWQRAPNNRKPAWFVPQSALGRHSKEERKDENVPTS